MSYFEFSAIAPESVLRRRFRKLHPSAHAFRVALWTGTAVAITIYSTGHPGEFNITANVNGNETKERFLEIQGKVENPSITEAQLHVNGATQAVSVASGSFSAKVPLTRGENLIWASVTGAAVNMVPGSNTIRVNADIAPADIWTALTWDGAGDIDLHLVLPGGQDCYYGQQSVGGAILDFDNKISDGPEHIVVEKALAGKYQVQVVYFAAAGAPRSVRWSADLRLRDGRQQYSFSGVLDTVKEVQTVTTFSFP